ncbi:MAG: cell division protein [Rhizobiaceae bacterium]|nr:MAG: cell division protein [Rhizobiaceae bacterium]CAG1005955.1 Protein adenylyltransferase VbhT [Rhizobiaceae bacterium]
MTDDPYVDPDSKVLRNKLGITDEKALDRAERALVTQRMREGVPRGKFDLDHLKAIHRHLFQDVYEWAGKIRTVEIAKDKSQFQFRQYIETGMADIEKRLKDRNYLRSLPRGEFAREAAAIIGDVNYVHPFREGNGRVQMQYLKQLCEQAGHPVQLNRIAPEAWMDASREAHQARYEKMADCIAMAIVPGRARSGISRDGGERER